MSDSDRPKPKPPVMPTPHTTPAIRESDVEKWEGIVLAIMLSAISVMMICLAILMVYGTWQMVVAGCDPLRTWSPGVMK